MMIRLALALLFLAWSCFAQLDRGTFTGAITDASGAAIPGAQVTIENAATKATYRTGTTGTGNYTMPNLPLGVYHLSFESQGFNRHIQRGVQLSASEVRRVDVVLEVGSVEESIEVTVALPRLQTDSSDVATNLVSSAMNDLPLAIGGGGRTMEDLVYKIVPGTYGSPWEQYIVGSQRWTKESLLEGASTVTDKTGHFGESSMSMEAVQEFKVQTSAISAEFGAAQRINVLPGELTNANFSKADFDFANNSRPGNTYLNKAVYADVAGQTLGTAAPYYSKARGFGTISEDFGLQKNHRFAEKYRFQIRAEFLNGFNRHYLGNPNTNIKNPLFGQVTSVSGNRSIQLGARFDF